MKDKVSFVLTVAVCTIFLAVSGYLNNKKTLLFEQLEVHGFDRVAVIEAEFSNNTLSMEESANLMANPPSLRDGPGAVMSRKSIEQLMSEPYVQSVMAIGKSGWQLENPDGFSTEITLFDVTPTFVKVFGLGDDAVLKRNIYIPSELLKARLINEKNKAFSLGVSRNWLATLPSEFQKKTDWATFKRPVNISDKEYSFPSGSPLFDNSLFTTESETTVTIGSMKQIQQVSMLVVFKKGFNIVKSRELLNTFAAKATAANTKQSLVVKSMDDFFEAEMKTGRLEQWAFKIEIGMLALFTFLYIILALVRHDGLSKELALRRVFGVSKYLAIWLSLKHTYISMAVGSLTGMVCGFVINYSRSEVRSETFLAAVLALTVMFFVGVFSSFMSGKLTVGKSLIEHLKL
jgi:hypothetical protein